MKALHVKDIQSDVAVYSPTEDSHLRTQQISESPVVHTRMGNGYLGYVGDVNYEEASSKVILAMLGLLDAPLSSSALHTGQRELKPATALGTGNNDLSGQVNDSGSKTNQGFVMLLSLENQVWFTESNAHLLSALREKIPWKQAFTTSTALGMLGSQHLYGVLVTDPGIAHPRNAQILSMLVEYVKSGGSAVMGTMFSSFMPLSQFDAFFQKSWGTSWKRGSYHRTTFALNPSHEMVKKNPSLVMSYSMKALHINGLAPDDTVYLPMENSLMESMVFRLLIEANRLQSEDTLDAVFLATLAMLMQKRNQRKSF